MKIIFSDFKKGEVKVKITTIDDLWYLSQIIDKNDIVKGETLRKIKIGQEENLKIVRKPVFLSISVEKTEFQRQSNIFRISGTILEGPDDVQKGAYHTISVEINTTITIIKKQWLDFQMERLKEASSESGQKILLVVFDREEANFAHATTYGYEYLSELKGNVQKKDDAKKIESTFYKDIIEQIKQYSARYNINKIVVASPAFWKDYLVKEITDPELKKRIITATCSSADKTAFNEVLKRPEVETALKESRAVEEISLVEELLKEIMKGKLAIYGLQAVSDAADVGAIKTLLISDSYIQKTRETNEFERVDTVLKKVNDSKGKIMIISSEHEGGKQLDGLGGIAAILRYQLN